MLLLLLHYQGVCQRLVVRNFFFVFIYLYILLNVLMLVVVTSHPHRPPSTPISCPTYNYATIWYMLRLMINNTYLNLLSKRKYGAFVFALRYSKILSRTIFDTYILLIAATPAASILCLMIFQILCQLYKRDVPRRLPMFLILLSNDIHFNPGPPFQNDFFNFMSWNVNLLAQDNFQRIRIIEARYSIFKYDLISICETS